MVRGGRFQFNECSAKNSKILRPSFNSRRLYLNTTLQHRPPPQHPGKPASRLIHHPSQPSRPMRTQLLMAAASAACASAFLLPLSSPQQRAPLLQRRAASTRMMVCTRVRWWVVGPWKPQPQHVDRSIDWFDRPPLSTTQQMKSSTPHSLKTTRRPPPPPPPPRPRPPPPR